MNVTFRKFDPKDLREIESWFVDPVLARRISPPDQAWCDYILKEASQADTAIRYGKALGCVKINCLAGIAPAGADREMLQSVLVANLQYAAPRLADAGIKVLLEPINLRDIPGFFVSHTDHAEQIFEAVGSDNLYLQYDVYHTQVMQGDLIPYERLRSRIAHVQLADNPGRNEPGTGEINYPNIFSALDRLGYEGFVGCEYKPKTNTTAGLGWMRPYL